MTARFLVLLLLPLFVVRASLIAKKPPSFESLSQKKAEDHASKPCGALCVDAKGATEKPQKAQEISPKTKTIVVVDSSDAAVAASAKPPQAPTATTEPPQCLCDTEGDKCSCNAACDKRQEVAICAALLGPCTCEERAGSMCECSGHCPAMGDLMHACQSAPGCMWDGYFCAAEKATKRSQIDSSSSSGGKKKSHDEELLDAAEAEVKGATAKAAFKLPRYVQAMCAVVAAALAAFILLHL